MNANAFSLRFFFVLIAFFEQCHTNLKVCATYFYQCSFVSLLVSLFLFGWFSSRIVVISCITTYAQNESWKRPSPYSCRRTVYSTHTTMHLFWFLRSSISDNRWNCSVISFFYTGKWFRRNSNSNWKQSSSHFLLVLANLSSSTRNV